MTADWTSWALAAGNEGDNLRELVGNLDETQWMVPEDIRAHQMAALTALVRHAHETVPYYRELFEQIGLSPDAPLTETVWSTIPILERADLRDLGDRLRARSYPAPMGPSSMHASGGSTGVPVRVRRTQLEGLLWNAVCLREQTWHEDGVAGTLANLKGISKEAWEAISKAPGTLKAEGGLIIDAWGPPVSSVWRTGRMGLLQPHHSPEAQLRFLKALRPARLLLRPSTLRLLLAHLREQKESLEGLRSVWTMSEGVNTDLRDMCRDVLGCEIVSNYSAGEAGYLALQCPTGVGYHVMSEVVRLEVLDADGRACEPGDIGRVIVTPLNNYAMPLLRYAIGDEAEAGAPCRCGRGLPVLSQIVGRVQDYLLLPDGSRRRVNLSHYRISAMGFIREFQVAQTGPLHAELRLAASRELSADERATLDTLFKNAVGSSFERKIVVVDEIAKTSSGKLLQFVNEFQR